MVEIKLSAILGKDPEYCTAEEIRHASETLQERLQSEQARAERRELTRRRAEYRLSKPTHRDEICTHNVCTALDRWFLSNDSITIGEYNTIVAANTRRVKNKFSEVYPCPECGAQGSLYVGRYDGGCMRVTCSCCEFVCPGPTQNYEDDAEDAFVAYLNEQGYIGEMKPEL